MLLRLIYIEDITIVIFMKPPNSHKKKQQKPKPKNKEKTNKQTNTLFNEYSL